MGSGHDAVRSGGYPVRGGGYPVRGGGYAVRGGGYAMRASGYAMWAGGYLRHPSFFANLGLCYQGFLGCDPLADQRLFLDCHCVLYCFSIFFRPTLSH
jgi:hypothetical protein